MAIAAAGRALTVVETKPAPETEIAAHLDIREKAKWALVAIDEELAKLAADLAKQVAAHAVGKPKLDTDAVLAQYKVVKARQDQLVEKRVAVDFLLKAVSARLDELKASAPAEFIIVLTRRIADQQKEHAKTQDEAARLQKVLDDLNDELAAIIAANPSAASSAAAAPASATPAATARAIAPAQRSGTRSRRRTRSSSRAATGAPAGPSTAAVTSLPATSGKRKKSAGRRKTGRRTP